MLKKELQRHFIQKGRDFMRGYRDNGCAGWHCQKLRQGEGASVL